MLAVVSLKSYAVDYATNTAAILVTAAPIVLTNATYIVPGGSFNSTAGTNRAIDIRYMIYDVKNNQNMGLPEISYSVDGKTYVSIYKITKNIIDIQQYKFNMSSTDINAVGYLTPYVFNWAGVDRWVYHTWYYPTALAGKSITIKIKNSAPIQSGSAAFEVTRQVQTFNYDSPTTTYELTPSSDGNFNFSWTTSESYTTKFDIYSDASYTELVKSVPVSNNLKSSSISIKLGAFNVNQTYYVKQVYVTPNTVSGYSITYEKKLLPFTFVGYKYPTIVTATTQFNANPIKIDLAITEGNTGSILASKYYVKRDGQYLGEFTGTNFTDANVTAYTKYTYVVYSVPDTWTNKEIVIPELSYTVSTTTNPKAISFDKYKLSPVKGTSPYIKIEWDNNQWYPLNTLNTVKLFRKNSTTNEFTTELNILSTDTYYKDFTDIIENKYYSYKLEINQWGKKTEKIDSVMVVDMAKITKISASKNTFGDRINLQWTIDRLNLCDRFEIWRQFAVTTSDGKEAWSDYTMVNQFTAQSLINSWDDRDAAPGTLYRYKIFAFKKTSTIPAYDISENATDIGFRMPVGVVTGRITYGAGSAVGGASLYVSSSSDTGDKLYKSLKFSGDNLQGGKVKLTKSKHGCIADKGFTFQAWLQPLKREAVISTIFEVDKEYSIRMYNDNILILMGNPLQQVRSYKLESTIAVNSYFHLGVAYSLDKKLKILINGMAKDSVVLTNTYTCAFNETTQSSIANNTSVTKLPYNGYIDDVRLWNKGITSTESADNYNRYLGGNETGLIGYWPMDEGIGNYAFDCSKTDKVFNESHIIDIVNAISDTIVPKKEQLSIKGVTDASGNYIIRGIPFTGDGSTYSITPILGTHKFEPKQQLRYVSPSSLIHNGTDFTDKSSFPVKVKVIYNNTEYPVAGVSFSVDDNPCSKENKLITTKLVKEGSVDAGECIIDVPIGGHYIKATLAGHEFKYKGRYPDTELTHDFDENSSGATILFEDITLVTVAGRVVGGDIEAAYPIGFKKSKANIGKAKIEIKPANSIYNLSATTRDLNDDFTKNDSTRFKSTSYMNKTGVVVTTDSITGEYMVKLPPIKWNIESVKTYKTTNYEDISSIDIINNIQSFETNTMENYFDTLKMITTNKIDTFKYNLKKSFTYKVKPIIEVRTAGSEESMAFGEPKWYLDDTNTTFENLYTYSGLLPKDIVYKYGKTINHPNGKPIFIQKKLYALRIKAYEKYEHPNTDITTVPLKGAEVNIQNEIGLLSKKIVPEPTDTIPNHTMKLDKNGEINYIFKAGFPNTAAIDEGLEMKISVKNGNDNPVEWTEMGTFKGIVLGCELLGGSNFVTKGPTVPLVVLRDPPGSNSYSYMEEGSQISYNISSKSNFNGSFDVKSQMWLGVGYKVGAGIGFMVMTEIENKNTITAGLEGQYASFTGDTKNKSITLKERIQTSSSPDFVGSNADVYIGVSTNIFYSNSNILTISNQKLLKTTAFSGESTADTEFKYTQNEILTQQIPIWKKRMELVLKTVSHDVYSGTAYNDSARIKNKTFC